MGVISEEHAAAARENGRRSIGPVTDAGKERSSGNAVVHGLRAERTTLRGEDVGEFAAHAERWLTALGCVDEAEREVGATIVRIRWMMARLDRLEQEELVAEAEARVREEPEGKHLALVAETARVMAVVADVLAENRAEDVQALNALLDGVRDAVHAVRALEAACDGLGLGSTELFGAVARVRLTSKREIEVGAYGALVTAARSCADRIAAQIPDAQAAVDRARDRVSKSVPLPTGKGVALRDRYRRDYERRLRTEMEFLGMLRERKAALGSFGEPVPVKVRIVS